MSESSFATRIRQLIAPIGHRQTGSLVRILEGKTSVSSTGYPYISTNSFRTFLKDIPHLFRDGDALQKALAAIEEKLGTSDFTEREKKSIDRALQVMRNMVYSAAICAPPDMWILKHVLSVHSAIGLNDVLLSGATIVPESLAAQFSLDARHLRWDLAFLHTRGYLRSRDKKYALRNHPQALDLVAAARPIPSEFLQDMVEPIADVLGGKDAGERRIDLVTRFLTMPEARDERSGWFASEFELEIGYRLVPLVLALHVLNIRKELGQAKRLDGLIPNLIPEAQSILENAGIIRADTMVTDVGLRVLSRGSGPFGIIHAYLPYMRVLQDKLSGKSAGTWVQRGKNIAASQDANRKTFEMANDSLDRFCTDQHFKYGVFIEHALGLGEAVRQRVQRTGEDNIQYFGADLEDAAIDRAQSLQQQGALPKNMVFIRNADIGNPIAVIAGVREAGFSTKGAVMFVGNGFHEVRGQTNERVIEIFHGYCEAGIIVAFTEESALSDHDLLATGWNTYHSGFRYVHELSGQGLRPSMGIDPFGRYSWKICASLGGYAVLPKYSVHTRTIYPYPRRGGYNPPISMTYFCVPAELATSLGFYPTSWGAAK